MVMLVAASCPASSQDIDEDMSEDDLVDLSYQLIQDNFDQTVQPHGLNKNNFISCAKEVQLAQRDSDATGSKGMKPGYYWVRFYKIFDGKETIGTLHWQPAELVNGCWVTIGRDYPIFLTPELIGPEIIYPGTQQCP